MRLMAMFCTLGLMATPAFGAFSQAKPSAPRPAAAPVAPAAPSAAPKPTAENAQRFLSIALKDRQIYDRRFKLEPARMLLNERDGCTRLPSGACWNGRYSTSTIESAQIRARTSTVSAAASEDVCTTRIAHNTQSAEMVQEYYPSYGGVYYAREEFKRQPQEVLALDWKKVSSARSDGGTLMLTTTQVFQGLAYGAPASNDPVIEIRFNDADLATRAAFAAEVIRMRCDPLSDTGF